MLYGTKLKVPYAGLSEKWVSAYALEKGDIVLPSDRKHGIIEKSFDARRVHQINEPIKKEKPQKKSNALIMFNLS